MIVFTDFLTNESFLYLHRQTIKNIQWVYLIRFLEQKKSTSKVQKVSYLNWIPLTSIEQLEEIKEQSKTESILIFKHSTRCGISSMVIKQFEEAFYRRTSKFKSLLFRFIKL